MRTSSLTACLLGLLGLVSCATPVQAARWVDVTVVNRSTGERLTPYRHQGKLYVAGSPGDRYGIELRNKDNARVLTVISVDGVNVLTGQTATALQSGYVLDGHRPYAITGWRKSMDEVAQFLFTALPDSYAARTGRPDNVGVIGVAVYREKVVPAPVLTPAPEVRYDSSKRESDSPRARRESARESARESSNEAAERPAAPAPSSLAKSLGPSAAEAESSASAAGQMADRRAKSDNAVEEKSNLPRQRLGTGHGEREHAPTRNTEFARASDTPDEVITIYYDSRANLLARGIIRAPKLAEPRPFPGGFVPDPQG